MQDTFFVWEYCITYFSFEIYPDSLKPRTCTILEQPKTMTERQRTGTDYAGANISTFMMVLTIFGLGMTRNNHEEIIETAIIQELISVLRT